MSIKKGYNAEEDTWRDSRKVRIPVEFMEDRHVMNVLLYLRRWKGWNPECKASENQYFEVAEARFLKEIETRGLDLDKHMEANQRIRR